MVVNDGYVLAADAAGVLVRSGTGLYYIDIESAAVTKAFSGVSATAPAVLSEDRIGWYGDGGLHFKPRTEPGGEEKFVELPGPYQSAKPALIGDWLLLPPQTGASSLTALSSPTARPAPCWRRPAGSRYADPATPLSSAAARAPPTGGCSA